jgi:uncharacterized peroxidase-related enzyme
MPPRIQPLNASDADDETAILLNRRERKWGKSFNVAKVIANAPAVLKIMDTSWDTLDQTSLSISDRELIAMELAVSNGCHYCVPAHRYFAYEESKFDAHTIDQLERVSNGETLSEDGRLATVQKLVRRLEATRGGLSDEELENFQEQGVTPQQMIETIAEIAHCTVTNFTNRLAQTPLDEFTKKYRR